jgi:hypothetical protein
MVCVAASHGAATVAAMDAIGIGLILIVNGLLVMVRHIADFTTVTGLFAAASLWWLATIEVEELNRQGAKPEVGRH